MTRRIFRTWMSVLAIRRVSVNNNIRLDNPEFSPVQGKNIRLGHYQLENKMGPAYLHR